VTLSRPFPGTFLAFEGVDGSGKSTQAKRCAEALTAQGHTVISVREPGGTAVSNAIRELVLDPSRKVAPTTELLLYMAARAQLVSEVIQPALEAGHVVVSDRFGWSTLAYQGFGRGMDRPTIDSLMRAACGSVWPDLMIVLDITPELRRQRLASQNRPLDRLEREPEDFFQKVRSGFLTLAQEGKTPSVVLNGETEISALTQAILSRIQIQLPALRAG
jgi:dTMP kinase